MQAELNENLIKAPTASWNYTGFFPIVFTRFWVDEGVCEPNILRSISLFLYLPELIQQTKKRYLFPKSVH